MVNAGLVEKTLTEPEIACSAGYGKAARLFGSIFLGIHFNLPHSAELTEQGLGKYVCNNLSERTLSACGEIIHAVLVPLGSKM